MSPEQQAALEALAGRALKTDEVTAIDTMAGNGQWPSIAAYLSDGRCTRTGSVTREVFLSWAASTGMLAVIEDKAAAAGDPLRNSALALRYTLQGGAAAIRLDYTSNQQMLAAWVVLGALSEANRDALLALAAQTVTVTDAQVRAAMGL